jgi:hypothetical protein
MSDKPELIPCPVCHTTDCLEVEPFASCEMRVICYNCSFYGPISSEDTDEDAERVAIELWNFRLPGAYPDRYAGTDSWAIAMTKWLARDADSDAMREAKSAYVKAWCEWYRAHQPTERERAAKAEIYNQRCSLMRGVGQ